MDTSTVPDDDPILHAIQEAQDIHNTNWTPPLNTILEETVIDLHIENDEPFIKATTHVSTKRHRGRLNKDSKLRHQYEAKVSAAIANNAIYSTTINTAQNDSGANRSVTNNKQLLVHYKAIRPYAIKGINDNSAAIHCTGIGYLP